LKMANATNVSTHLYDTYEHAKAAVRDLEAAGVPGADISIISKDADGNVTETNDGTSGAATGASVGTVLGGGAGLLAGLGMMAIPGIGPVVAAGWLAATALGAVVGMAGGGILGALTDLGVSDDHANVYAESLRRGGTLIAVKTAELSSSSVNAIMDRHGPVDPAARASLYRSEGWNKFEERGERARQSDDDNRRYL
jgi:uncharacterized membrane protein